VHTRQCFQVPITTSQQLDKLSREFFWRHTNTEKGLPLVAWNKLCLPKSKGGIGLRRTKAVNKAFQCKLAWEILTNKASLWAQMMRDKYLHKKDFLNYQNKSTDSPVWKSLFKCRLLIKQGVMWQIGNGESISFWYDNWIENKNLIEILDVDEATIPSSHAQVSDFIL